MWITSILMRWPPCDCKKSSWIIQLNFCKKLFQQMSCGQSQINCYNRMKTFVQQSICTLRKASLFYPLFCQGFCRFDMTLTLASAWRKKGMFAWLFRKRKEPLRPIVDYCKGCMLLLLSHSPIDRTNEALLPWSLTVRIASIEHTTSTLAAALKHTGNSYNFLTIQLKRGKRSNRIEQAKREKWVKWTNFA